MPWTPDQPQRRFIREFGDKVLNDEAALFIGAGVSRAAGYFDWTTLMSGIAKDLGLDIAHEPDLPAIAQYHHNEDDSREKINQTIIDALTQGAQLTPVHRILSRLPIDTVWTTNYERLLEQAYESAGRSVEVKLSMANLAQARKGREVVLYKMHGCVTQPHEAVLTKDDYDLYDQTRLLFTDSLKGDFIEKTLLFLGFSFTDPNIERVLAKLRAQLPDNRRTHYWITRMARVDPQAPEADKAAQQIEARRASLKSADLLKRNRIRTVWIDEYSDLEPLLAALETYVMRKGVFVAGSAADPMPLGKQRLDDLSHGIGSTLIERGFNLVSGFGRGVAEQVVLGALRALFSQPRGRHEERLVIRPFPGKTLPTEKATVYTRHRVDLIARAGAVIVLAGNKLGVDGAVDLAAGVEEEVALAKTLGKAIIPIGASGHVARKHWEAAVANPVEYLGDIKDDGELATLGESDASTASILDALGRLLSKIESAAAAKA